MARKKDWWDGAVAPHPRPEERVWKTRDGREIPYSKIDPGHLVNILLWLRRRSLKKAREAASKDGAWLHADGWLARKAPDFDGLLEEARRRGGKVHDLAEIVASRQAIDEETIRKAATAFKRAARRLQQRTR